MTTPSFTLPLKMWDLTIETADHKHLYFSKAMLSLHSEVFAKMFSNDGEWVEQTSNILKLDASKESVEIFLGMMWNLPFPQHDAKEVVFDKWLECFRLAHLYFCTKILDALQTHFKKRFCKWYNLARLEPYMLEQLFAKDKLTFVKPLRFCKALGGTYIYIRPPKEDDLFEEIIPCISLDSFVELSGVMDHKDFKLFSDAHGFDKLVAFTHRLCNKDRVLYNIATRALAEWCQKFFKAFYELEFNRPSCINTVSFAPNSIYSLDNISEYGNSNEESDSEDEIVSSDSES